MKTSSSHKLKLLRYAFKQKHVAYITLRGQTAEVTVKDVRNVGHSVEFMLDRGRGFLVVDPDDLLSVRFHQIPAKPAPDDDSLYEVNIDDA